MRLVNYRTDQGRFPALVKDGGSKWLHVIFMDAAGIRVRKVHKAEGRYMTDLEDPASRKTKRRFIQAARLFGGTKAAIKLLRSK